MAAPLPGGLTSTDLASAEPYTVARTAVRRSGVTTADRCLVVGAGAQGLLVCLVLARLGVTPVVTEPHPLRLARAERLGAVRDDGRTGFTYVFETSGHAPALRPPVDRAAPGATPCDDRQRQQRSLALTHDPDRPESHVIAPLYTSSKAALTMLTTRYAKRVKGIRVNAADPGRTATDFNGHSGFQTVTEGTDAIVALATEEPGAGTGHLVTRHGEIAWP